MEKSLEAIPAESPVSPYTSSDMYFFTSDEEMCHPDSEVVDDERPHHG